MLIREAQIEDATSIKELIWQLGYEIQEGEVEKNIAIYKEVKGLVLIAEENAAIVGFISGAAIPLFHVYEQMFRITALCVHQNHKAQGIGKRLVNAIEEKCKENGCYYIELTSGAHRNSEAHIFYARLGYTIYEGKLFRKRIEV